MGPRPLHPVPGKAKVPCGWWVVVSWMRGLGCVTWGTGVGSVVRGGTSHQGNPDGRRPEPVKSPVESRPEKKGKGMPW